MYTGPQFVGTPTTMENQTNGSISTPTGAQVGESLFVFVKGRIGAVGNGAATEDFTLTGFTSLGGTVETGGQNKAGVLVKTVDAADVTGTTYTLGATSSDVFSGYAWMTRVSAVVELDQSEFDIDESSTNFDIPVLPGAAQSLAIVGMGPSSTDQEPPPAPWVNAGGIDDNIRVGTLELESAGNVGGQNWGSLSFNNGYKALAVTLVEVSGGGVDETVVPAGGVEAGGAVVPAVARVPVPSGGGVAGGGVSPAVARSVAPAGGAVVGGVVVPSVARTVSPAGGLLVGGAAAVGSAGAVVHVPSGGVEIGGQAGAAVTRVPVPSGGAVVGGAGAVTSAGASVHVPVGGAVVGGGAAASVARGPVPSGGGLVGGQGVVAAGRVVGPAGGVLVGGQAAVVSSIGGVHSPSGGGVVGGQAAVAAARAHVPAGGGRVGGAAVPAVARVHVPAGGAVAGGQVVPVFGTGVQVSGGAIVGGAAVVSKARVYGPGGGALAGGSAEVSLRLIHLPGGGWLVGGAATVVSVDASETVVAAWPRSLGLRRRHRATLTRSRL